MARRIRATLLAAGAVLMAVSGVTTGGASAQASRQTEVARPMADASRAGLLEPKVKLRGKSCLTPA